MADRVVETKIPLRLAESEARPVTQKVIGVPTGDPWQSLDMSISDKVWGEISAKTSFDCPIWLHTHVHFQKAFTKKLA